MEYLAVLNGEGKFIKEKMIGLEEESREGRLLDIDIYDKDFSQISRSSLGLAERKCIICDYILIFCANKPLFYL